jgi:hypothetical protein
MAHRAPTDTTIRVADQVWIATALLHRESPGRADFSVGEIIERVESEGLAPKSRRGTIRVHINQHCVGNSPPFSGNYRMLYATGSNTRRLFREGDAAAPGRKGKIVPRRDEIPERYHGLLNWYAGEYRGHAVDDPEDPLLALRGSGRAVWADEGADDYVDRLRATWP